MKNVRNGKVCPRTGHEGPKGLSQLWDGWLTPRLGRSSRERHPVLIVQKAGRAPGPVWTVTGIRSPDRPVRNESVYLLRCPGPRDIKRCDKNLTVPLVSSTRCRVSLLSCDLCFLVLRNCMQLDACLGYMLKLQSHRDTSIRANCFYWRIFLLGKIDMAPGNISYRSLLKPRCE